MRRWGILLGLFLLLFSPPALGKESSGVSLKELLLKLEQDLRNGAPKKKVEEELRQIEKAKENYPVYYLPELNYLLEREVEKVPQSPVSLIKKCLYYLQPFQRALEVLTILVLFYTFTFYFQHVELEPTKKRFITLLAILALAASVIVGIEELLFLLTGLGVFLAASLKKRRTALFIFLSGLLLTVAQGAVENGLNLVKNPKSLYNIKVERDGYAPQYLIEEAIEEPTKRKIELITTELALGELSKAEELKKIKPKDPLLLGIIYNNLGYASYMKGDYQRALEYFKRANKIVYSPIILFNLYITYSSLLKLEEANKIRQELVKHEVNITSASPIPLLIHVKAEPPQILIPTTIMGSFLLGLAASLGLVKLLSIRTDRPNSGVLQIPGMMSYINSNFRFFFMVFIVSLAINFILGRAICSI